jgi:DNA polymerase-1
MCTDCGRSEGIKNVCITPTKLQDDLGGILVVLATPDAAFSHSKKTYAPTTRLILSEISRLTDYPSEKVKVAYAAACRGSGSIPEPEEVAACRKYLAQVVQTFQPMKILCFGASACASVVGYKPSRLRGGWGLTRGDLYYTPVRFFEAPEKVASNPLLLEQFKGDLREALLSDETVHDPWTGSGWVIETPQDAHAIVEELKKAEWATFDCETTGVRQDPDGLTIVALAVCRKGGRPYVWGEKALRSSMCTDPLLEWLQSKKHAKIAHNAPFDMGAVEQHFGVRVRGVIGDSRLWSRMLEPDLPGSLDAASNLCGMGDGKVRFAPYLAAAKKLMQKELRERTDLRGSVMAYAYAKVDQAELLRYCLSDALMTAELSEILISQLKSEPSLAKTWNFLVKDALAAVAVIQANGISTDKSAVENAEKILRDRYEKALARCAQISPTLNPLSPKQVGELLFKDLKLPVLRRTATGAPSVDEATLKKLQGEHQIVADLLEIRKLSKLLGTYVEAIKNHSTGKNRIHPRFLLDGAASGRLSCREPNLQNVPRPDSAEGTLIRDCFAPPAGWTLVQADYSQLELRVASALSGDRAMCEAFQSGEDFHMKTAKMISQVAWGIDESQVEKKHRTAAKAVNFGLLYGMADEGLAANIGCSPVEAKRVREAVLGRFSSLARWISAQLSEARRSGYSWTILPDGSKGRRRPVMGVKDPEPRKRSHYERASWNTPVQGTASDLCLQSLARVIRWIEMDDIPAKLVLTVHDSIILEVRDDAVEEAIFSLREIMQGEGFLGVPLVVDVETGPTWARLKPVEV